MKLRSILRSLLGKQDGAAAVMTALAMPVIIGTSGLVVDAGFVFQAERALQASADAAALAGAQNINVGSGGTAIGVAISYSAVSGNANANAKMTVTMAPGYPALKCLKSTGVSCSGPDSANAIVVQEKATIPTFFARVLGVSSVNISATATASAKGGSLQQIDAVIILDTTASMNNADSACSGNSREQCAQAGARLLLSGLWPCSPTLPDCGSATNGNVANPLDRVALMVFPGLKNATQAQYDYNCGSTKPVTVAYNASPDYLVVPFSSDYLISDTAASLNTSSDVVRALGGGGSGCSQGIQAVGGFGTFYADALTAAQAYLTSSGQANSQKIIILLSDGGANASSSNMPSAEKSNQCHEAITAAQAATAAGTWVYSIAYGSTISTSPSDCTTDSPAISSCSTMQQIASDATKFYSDTSGGDGLCSSTDNPSLADLNSIFQNVGTSGTSPRLIPNNTT